MTATRDEPGQPLGELLPDWRPPPPPRQDVLPGRFVKLVPLAPEHAGPLSAAFAEDAEGRNWTYLPYGPFPSTRAFADWVGAQAGQNDPVLFAIVDAPTGAAQGIAGYLRIEPAHGCIEIGHVHFAPALQRTAGSTEAIWLLMQQAFELGYRRCEWKCHTMNLASRRAAQRFGFSFEGVWRQARVVKGRNRDTAWFAAIDRDYPALKRAFEAWLAPENFDEQGVQRVRLSALTQSLLAARDPALENDGPDSR